MPNHYHLLIYTKKEPTNISHFIKSLQVSYARHFNNKYKHSGHVFQGTYKAKPILDPIYMQKIIKYIKNNPVKDGLVKRSNDWKYC
jgi:putative transposase